MASSSPGASVSSIGGLSASSGVVTDSFSSTTTAPFSAASGGTGTGASTFTVYFGLITIFGPSSSGTGFVVVTIVGLFSGLTTSGTAFGWTIKGTPAASFLAGVN